MKKRWFIAALIGLEMLSIPAAAQMVERVVFSVPQKAITVPLPAKPGHASFIVMSNAPFTVVAKDSVGDFDVSLTAHGKVNGNTFGKNAQMPGAPRRCASLLTKDQAAIYRATQKTAAKRGEMITQAIRVDVKYDARLSPTFDIQTAKESQDIPRAAPCASELG